MRISDISALKNYFSLQPVVKVWLFGSFARGEETEDSDIDLLVDFDETRHPSLLKKASMILDIENLLQRQVDLVTNGTLCPEIVPFVDKDKILIYERGN